MEISNDIDQDDIHDRESVGSILQRIASFSKVETKVPVSEPNLLIPLSNGIKKDSPAIQRKELKRSEGKMQCPKYSSFRVLIANNLGY